MSDLYHTPPTEKCRYQSEPGFRPRMRAVERNPWLIAFLLAALAALTGSALLWHTHQAGHASTAPQTPVETRQPAAQP